MLASLDDVDASDAFRHAIADELFAGLAEIGLPEDAQDEAVGAFFHAVECALEEVIVESLERASIGLSCFVFPSLLHLNTRHASPANSRRRAAR